MEKNITYSEFIQNIINTRGQWPEKLKHNCERHHIVLKCKGGLPKSLNWKHHTNVIWLTCQEHFYAHKLLALENPDDIQIQKAWTMMAFPKGKTKRSIEITADEYAQLKAICISINKTIDHSDTSWVTESFKNKQRQNKLGRHWYNNGITQVFDYTCPEGFVAGMLPNHSWTTTSGRHWYNNGEIDVMAYECPDGFIAGRLSNRYYNKNGEQR